MLLLCMYKNLPISIEIAEKRCIIVTIMTMMNN